MKRKDPLNTALLVSIIFHQSQSSHMPVLIQAKSSHTVTRIFELIELKLYTGC